MSKEHHERKSIINSADMNLYEVLQVWYCIIIYEFQIGTNILWLSVSLVPSDHSNLIIARFMSLVHSESASTKELNRYEFDINCDRTLRIGDNN